MSRDPAGATGRRGRERAGRRAERLAELWLRLKGCRILARRFACHAGEIDLIAREGGLLLFVEVKRRAGPAAAIESLRPLQQRRIAQAAEAFLQRRPELRGLGCRFDLIAVSPWRLPVHLKDVWRG